MVTRHARGKVTWVDMESPSPEELHSVMREFSIDPRIEEEILSPTPYPIVVSFPKYVYMILHFPTTQASDGPKNQEIDFIVGKDFLITARYEVIESLHSLHKVFEAEELLGLSSGAANPTEELLERIMRRLYGAIREEAERASFMLERIEKDIFSGKEKENVRTISNVNRTLLRFDTTLERHNEALATFLSELDEFFGKDFKVHALQIQAERDHAASLITSYREVASELRTTNDSLLSASQNEVMKTLTVVTFTLLPLSVIAALFQMNVSGAPFTDDPHSWLVIFILMVVLSGLVLLYTKHKKWL